jgi:hypothetical protein
MKPEKGKYYRVAGFIQFRKVYGPLTKEIYMVKDRERTRIEIDYTTHFEWDNTTEITKEQFDRYNTLAEARIKQYEYYSIPEAKEALMEEIDRELKPLK